MSNFDPTRPGVVYALVDPRTSAVRYVGATQTSPKQRLHEHVTGCGSTRPWADELRAQGLTPVVRILREVADGRDLDATERSAIAEHALAGADLLNIEANPVVGVGLAAARAQAAAPPLLDQLVAEGLLTPEYVTEIRKMLDA